MRVILCNRSILVGAMAKRTTFSFYFSEPATTSCTIQITGEKWPSPNAKKPPDASKHRKMGIDPSRTNEFPWLETTEDDSSENGMWCSICRKPSTMAKQMPLGKAVYVEVPSKTIMQQSLRNHLDSHYHKEAMRGESAHILAEKQGGGTECFDAVVSIQKKAFIGHLKCMHFLAKQEIAHTTKFKPLVNLPSLLDLVTLGR